MVSSRCFKCAAMFCLISRNRFVLLPIAFSLCLLYIYTHSSFETSRHITSIPTSKPRLTITDLSTKDDAVKVITKANGFLAATRTNQGKIHAFSVCVVDPAMTECANMGFAAFLLQTLTHIEICRALGSDHPVVFWQACNSACSRNRRVNSWLWYFEPVNPGLESKVERVLCPLVAFDKASGSIVDYSFSDRSTVEGFEDSQIITAEERMRVNTLIKQYVKPNTRIERKVRKFFLRYLAGFTVLGVHVRGTDHWIETVEKRLPPLMDWVKSAQIILETLPRPRKIFIASDNSEIIKTFLTFFGNVTVVYTKAFRARRYHSQVPPHEIKFEHNPADPYERAVGTQVLMDILLLAKCDHFLHAESSVASLASYFNPHMESYFMDGAFTKGQDKVRERLETNRRRNVKQEDLYKEDEDEEDFQGLDSSSLECFVKNHATSTCSNAAKGIFVNLEGAKSFLKGY